jgi:hypothetical protein
MNAGVNETGPGGFERRVGVGIRLKLFGFLLPLIVLLIVSMTWVVTEVTQSTLRRDLLQRGAAISRVVALSAGNSLLSKDPLGPERLVSETKASDPDIAFVSIRDASDVVVAHDRVAERGKPYRPVPPLLPLGTFGDTRIDEVVRDGRRLIEYTTPISFAGRHVGIASLGLSMGGLETAQRAVRERIFKWAAFILAIAFVGTLVLSKFFTTPVKRLHQAVLSLAGNETFQPMTNWARSRGTSTGWRRRSSPRRPPWKRRRVSLKRRISAWSASSPRRWTRGTRTRWGTRPAWPGRRARSGAASG